MNVTTVSEPSDGHRSRATMREVAALAGVSIKTVSRVVNDEPNVAEVVRERVRAALERLEYRPNLAASNLRRTGSRTATLGVLLQDIGNSFSAALLRALEDASRSRGSAVLAASLDEEPDRERALVADLVARRVDGLVLMPATESQEYLGVELRAGLPIVFVDRAPRGVVADAVTADNRAGGILATRHLIDGGHRRIAYLGDLPSIQTAALRHRGFLDGMSAAGIPVDDALVRLGLRDADGAARAVSELMAAADPPTAVFAGRNAISIGVLTALRSLGLHRTTAIVGFDDFPLADLMNPPLTVVRQDVYRMGQVASELLFARLDGERAPARELVIAPTLVPRGSGEIPVPDRASA